MKIFPQCGQRGTRLNEQATLKIYSKKNVTLNEVGRKIFLIKWRVDEDSLIPRVKKKSLIRARDT